MKKKRITKLAVVIVSAAMVVSLAACGSNTSSVNYKDGTYTGRSSERPADEDGNGSGYGEVEIEIKDNRITACTFKTYELDGTLKDENYGSDLTKENRMKAQKAVQAADKYAEMVVENGSADDVDAISGATINCEELKEAAADALSKAEIKD